MIQIRVHLASTRSLFLFFFFSFPSSPQSFGGSPPVQQFFGEVFLAYSVDHHVSIYQKKKKKKILFLLCPRCDFVDPSIRRGGSEKKPTPEKYTRKGKKKKINRWWITIHKLHCGKPDIFLSLSSS
jgi:hypothetical protein